MNHEELLRHLRGIQYIVINITEGSRFSLSKKAIDLYLELAGIKYTLEPQLDRDTQNKLGSKIIVNDKQWDVHYIDRDDPALVNVIRRLGIESYGNDSELKIIEVPANVQWYIDEYDGREWVAEKHRIWD